MVRKCLFVQGFVNDVAGWILIIKQRKVFGKLFGELMEHPTMSKFKEFTSQGKKGLANHWKISLENVKELLLDL